MRGTLIGMFDGTNSHAHGGSHKLRKLHSTMWAAIVEETHARHGTLEKKKIPFVEEPLHPQSRFRVLWDLLVSAAVIYLAIELPRSVGGFTAGTQSPAWKWTLDIFFYIDIVLSFRTGFMHKGEVVMDQKSRRAALVVCDRLSGLVSVGGHLGRRQLRRPKISQVRQAAQATKLLRSPASSS